MSKLYRARSLLYRRQILQENIRWKALDEIYKIYMFLHRSDLNTSENIRQIVSHFSEFFRQNFTKFDTKMKKIGNSLFHSRKNVDDCWPKFGDLSGVKVCKSCRSRQELSNEYLLAKIGVDTAENEPLKVWRKIQFIIHSPP